MAITRTQNTFSNLYYLIRVRKETGSWNNIPGYSPASSNIFRFATLSNDSYYGTAPDVINIQDWGLSISTIDNSFGGLLTEKPVAKIPKTSFSIDNLELFYHRLCEANGGDLNSFYGAEVDVFLCNGLVPGLFWTGLSWNNDFGVADPLWQLPNPGANYPNDDFIHPIFKGTINDIGFSTSTTSFSCLGVSDKINRKFGTLSGLNSNFKTRGQIIPITYGNWTQDGDLAPLILERDSQDIPRIFLDTQPIDRLDNLRLYDKVSELDYRVENTKVVDETAAIVTFQDSTSSADLEANISDDSKDWDNGSQLDNVLTNHFPGDTQLLYNLDGESVAFHHDFDKFPTNPTYTTNRSASRGWSGGEILPHVSTDELFGIDAEIQKANAIITIDLLPSELYLSNGGNLSEARGTGSFQLTLENTDPNEQDLSYSKYFFKVGGVYDSSVAIPAPDGTLVVTMEANLILKYKDFGFSGEVLAYDVEASVLAQKINSVDFGVFTTCGLSIVDPNNSTNSVLLLPLLCENAADRPQEFATGVGSGSAFFTDTETLKNGLSLDFTINSNANDSAAIPTNLTLNYFAAQCKIRVYAENGLWYWKGLGRIDSTNSLIEAPSDVLADIQKKELQFLQFIDATQSRSDWKNSFSLYGNEPTYRAFVNNFCKNNGAALYQDAAGYQVLFDLEKKFSPDHTINMNQIELKDNLQGINYTFTDRENIYNEFILKFRANPANKQFLNILKINENEITSTEPLEFFTSGDAPALRERCEDATEYLGLDTGEVKQFVFESSIIRDQRTAEQLLQHLVRWHTTTKVNLRIDTILSETYDFELGDQVILGDVDGLPEKVKDAQYIITGKRINPNLTGAGPSIQISMTEVI